MDIDISALSAGLQERRTHYKNIFELSMDEGFADTDFVNLATKEKYEIKRKTLNNITQQGGKLRNKAAGDINNATGFMVIESREGKLSDAKVDLGLGVDEIIDLNNSFMQEIGSSDPNDIYSVAGFDYIMDDVFAQIGQEVYDGIYDAELGKNNNPADASTAFQGGLNLYDGLAAKFDDAIADGSIAAGQVIAASAVSAANVLVELGKIIDKVWANKNVRREMTNPKYKTINYAIYLPSEWEGFIVDALEALPYKDKKIIREKDGVFVPSKLKRTELRFRGWLDDSQEAFFTPTDNVFKITQEGVAGSDARSVCKLEIEKVARTVQILIDFKMAMDFADPRYLVLYKAA